MQDLRAQLPECPLAYEVPDIPGNRTALVIPITAADIGWQEKMLPWTLASLINNTDLVMQGVHLYIACKPGTKDRIRTALKNFDLPEGTMIDLDSDATLMVSLTDLDTVYRNPLCFMDINYWAFRDASNTHKLSIGQITADTLAETEPYPDISSLSPDARLYDMKASTLAQFRHAIKQLMGAQLAMKM